MSFNETMTLYKINGSYLLKHGTYGSSIVEVDGKRFLDFKEGWLDKKPTTISLISKGRRVKNYGSLSVEEYFQALDGITPEKRDCGGNPIFNPEERYAYDKFLEAYQPIYEDYEEQTTPTILEYDITGDLSNPYIKPLRFLGQEPIKDGKVVYSYTPIPYKMAQDIAKHFGFEEVDDAYRDNTKGMKWSVPNHSKDTLEYLKINGNYATGKLSLKGMTYGTLDECQALYISHIDKITGIFKHAKDMMNAVGVPLDKVAVITELESLKLRIAKINTKRNSDEQPHNVCASISKLINTILEGETKKECE